MTGRDGCCLGIDVGGTKVSAALFSFGGELTERTKLELDRSAPDAAAAQIATIIDRYSGIADGGQQSLHAVGIAVPGVVFQDSGEVWAPNVPGWDHYPLRDRLRAATGIEAVLDSDRSAYVLGEHWRGAAVGVQNVVFLAVGTGIGAGILMNGELWSGSGGVAGAVGWFALSPDFRPQYAHKGCFECEASGTAVGERAVRMLETGRSSVISDAVGGDLTRVTAETVIAAARSGDAVATEVVRETARFLAMGIANIVSTLNPDVVVLGGGLFQAGRLLLDPIEEEFTRWVQPLAGEQVRLELSALGEDAGLYGSGRLAWAAVDRAGPVGP